MPKLRPMEEEEGRERRGEWERGEGQKEGGVPGLLVFISQTFNDRLNWVFKTF